MPKRNVSTEERDGVPTIPLRRKIYFLYSFKSIGTISLKWECGIHQALLNHSQVEFFPQDLVVMNWYPHPSANGDVILIQTLVLKVHYFGLASWKNQCWITINKFNITILEKNNFQLKVVNIRIGKIIPAYKEIKSAWSPADFYLFCI